MDKIAYAQGQQAHRRELLPEDCPYTSGDARASWMLGWKFAETGEVEFAGRIRNNLEDNMKIKLQGGLYMQPNEFNPANPKISFWDGKETGFWVGQGYIPLCEYTIEAETPEVDVIAGQVQCLMVKRDRLVKEFEQATGKIDDALAQLKSLTFDASGVAA